VQFFVPLAALLATAARSIPKFKRPLLWLSDFLFLGLIFEKTMIIDPEPAIAIATVFGVSRATCRIPRISIYTIIERNIL
jgi:hypothetical protein